MGLGTRDDSPGPLQYRLWCGGLDKDITPQEVQRKMERFGEVLNVSIRSSQRDTFAFIQFKSGRAIEEAIAHMETSSSLGPKVRVARATADDKKFQRRPPAPRGDSREPPHWQPGGDDYYRDDYRDDPRRRRGSYRGRDDSRDRGGGRGGYRDDYREGAGYSRGGHRGGYRDDSRDCRPAGRYDRQSPRRRHSPPPPPPPRYSGGRSGVRSRTPRQGDDGRGASRGGTVPIGRYKITVENLPEDMSWLELKDLGRDYGPSLTFARTYRHRGCWFGMLEFKEMHDAERVVKELDRRRVQGSSERLIAYMGPGPAGD